MIRHEPLIRSIIHDPDMFIPLYWYYLYLFKTYFKTSVQGIIELDFMRQSQKFLYLLTTDIASLSLLTYE